MKLSWYIKLNIMVMGFLFVLFLMKQVQDPAFRAGLSRIFSPPGETLSTGSPAKNRTAKIQKYKTGLKASPQKAGPTP